MDSRDFAAALSQIEPLLQKIKMRAHALHDSVGQTYGGDRPYWVHLDMVADITARYAAEVCADAADAAAIIFGAYFHDSMEDARLTYNDTMTLASEYLTAQQALMATEIVYALTNEKGRTRAERANDRYYQGIRTTPYAPLVKLADRLANATFSASEKTAKNRAMHAIYSREMPHFLEAITATDSADPRLQLPPSMVAAARAL